jgi:hypothetical protein
MAAPIRLHKVDARGRCRRRLDRGSIGRRGSQDGRRGSRTGEWCRVVRLPNFLRYATRMASDQAVRVAAAALPVLARSIAKKGPTASPRICASVVDRGQLAVPRHGRQRSEAIKLIAPGRPAPASGPRGGTTPDRAVSAVCSQTTSPGRRAARNTSCWPSSSRAHATP